MLNKFLGIMKNERIILKCFLVISILFTLMYIFSYKTLFHSDAATANLLAREQSNENSFFPKDWFYAQDIWVLGINNIVILINKLISDTLLSRAIAVVIQSTLLIVVVIKMFKKFQTKNGILVCLVLICSGISDLFLEMFYGQAAYANIVLCTLFPLLLLFNIIDNDLSSKKRLVYSSILMFFSVLLNMIGLRYIFYFFVPLLLSIFIYLLFEYVKSSKLKESIVGYIISFCLFFLAIIIGFILYSFVIKHTGFVKGVTNLTFSDSQNIFNNVKIYMIGFMQLFSVLPKSGTSFLTMEGMFSFYRMLILLILIVCIPGFMLSRYKSLSNKYLKITLLFYSVSLFLTSYVYIFGSIGNGDTASSRYFLIIFFVSLILLGAYYDNFVQKKTVIIRTVFILCLIPLLISSYLINIKSFYSLDRGTNQVIKKENRLKEVEDFLQNNNLHFGYGTYWNAGALTVLSNYKIEVPAIELASLTPFYWLSSKKWYQNDYHTGETFLLLLDDERSKVNKDKLNSYLGEPKKIFKESNFEIYVYDFNISSKLPGWPMIKGAKQLIKAKDLPSLTGSLQGDSRIAIEGKDKAGVLSFGPYTKLSQGKYIVKLNYKAEYDDSSVSLSKWDLGFAFPDKWMLLEQGVMNSTSGTLAQIISKEIQVSSGDPSLELRTFFEGKGSVTISSIEIERID